MLGGFVDLREGLDGVEDGLHRASVEFLVEDGLEIEVFDLTAAGEDSGALAVRGDEATTVDLDLTILADEAELDGEPEEASHALEFIGIGESGADLAVALEEVSKDGMCVHGDVAEDVVEDIGLWSVFHCVSRAEPGGGWKHARGEHLEEGVGREEAADWSGLPAGAWLEAGADFSEVGKAIFAEADLVEALEVLLAGMVAELRHATRDEFRPDGVLFGSVRGPVLFDEERCCYVELALREIRCG